MRARAVIYVLKTNFKELDREKTCFNVLDKMIVTKSTCRCPNKASEIFDEGHKKYVSGYCLHPDDVRVTIAEGVRYLHSPTGYIEDSVDGDHYKDFVIKFLTDSRFTHMSIYIDDVYINPYWPEFFLVDAKHLFGGTRVSFCDERSVFHDCFTFLV